MEAEDQSVVSLMLHISGQLSSIQEEQRVISDRLHRLEQTIFAHGAQDRVDDLQVGKGVSVSGKNILTTTKAGLQENPKLTQLTARLPPVEEPRRLPKLYDYYTTTYQHYFSPRDKHGKILTF